MIHGYEDQFVGIVSALTGCFFVTVAVTNWSWYYSFPSARFLEKRLGRRGVRCFHGVLGLALLALGAALFTGHRFPVMGP